MASTSTKRSPFRPYTCDRGQEEASVQRTPENMERGTWPCMRMWWVRSVRGHVRVREFHPRNQEWNGQTRTRLRNIQSFSSISTRWASYCRMCMVAYGVLGSISVDGHLASESMVFFNKDGPDSRNRPQGEMRTQNRSPVISCAFGRGVLPSRVSRSAPFRSQTDRSVHYLSNSTHALASDFAIRTAATSAR